MFYPLTLKKKPKAVLEQNEESEVLSILIIFLYRHCRLGIFLPDLYVCCSLMLLNNSAPEEALRQGQNLVHYVLRRIFDILGGACPWLTHNSTINLSLFCHALTNSNFSLPTHTTLLSIRSQNLPICCHLSTFFKKRQKSSLRVTFPFSLLFRICWLYSSNVQMTHQPPCHTKINVNYAVKTFQIVELIF